MELAVHKLRIGLALAVILWAGAIAAAAEKIIWKPLEQAVLRIDERAPRSWNAYRVEKRDYLFLVAVGRRFLMLDLRAREIYELDPATLARKDQNLIWDDTRAEAGAEQDPRPPGEGRPRRLRTEAWTLRDVGLAKRIRVRLADEGRVMDLQVPIKPDLRSLY